MAYINPGILEEDWDALGDWADGDTNGGVSEIDPAGQLHLDCTSLTANGSAIRTQDIGAIGIGNYYVEIRFIGDTWDGFGDGTHGLNLVTQTDGNGLFGFIGNGFTAGDGIIAYGSGAAYTNIYSHTWDNNWHTVVFYIHNSQTDCDIWVDKDPATEAADVTDADVDAGFGTDGESTMSGYGTQAGNGEYHVDYLYIGTGIQYSLTVAVGAFVLTGISVLLTKALNIACAVGSFTLTGINVLLTRGYTIVASVGEFTLTGINAILTSARNMAVSVGEFTLTGINVALNKGWAMAISVGQFILTGIDVAWKYWTRATKHTAAYTNEDKHTASYTQESKNTDSWEQEGKN